ncbi:hypothetical protein GBZ26_03940 [Azospirillum formosense]|uniref:Uncharacterized protein n=1 Tax=Azospirillum formosense TaxID=861533 RepID=A0ABX2KZM6_9PROT|nr:hypothetical protein [Azospirillum formosense]MBY3755750.1 hypothetical protein [Azospirillum formosense]NUB18375.1 hypothetical protein [Azospirillum formosense]
MTRQHVAVVPFVNAEEAWLWTCRMVAGSVYGVPVQRAPEPILRPCQPLDVAHAVDQLYRRGQFTRDHLAVLGHYGRRRSAPDPTRDREARARLLWDEAFGQIAPVLAAKGFILREPAETAAFELI